MLTVPRPVPNPVPDIVTTSATGCGLLYRECTKAIKAYRPGDWAAIVKFGSHVGHAGFSVKLDLYSSTRSVTGQESETLIMESVAGVRNRFVMRIEIDSVQCSRQHGERSCVYIARDDHL